MPLSRLRRSPRLPVDDSAHAITIVEVKSAAPTGIHTRVRCSCGWRRARSTGPSAREDAEGIRRPSFCARSHSDAAWGESHFEARALIERRRHFDG
jgi:hypothetical protein